jgi:hypothetical protein
MKLQTQQERLREMREQFASNMRESVELAKEHFSLMKSEQNEPLIMFQDIDSASPLNASDQSDKKKLTSRSFSLVMFDALHDARAASIRVPNETMSTQSKPESLKMH